MSDKHKCIDRVISVLLERSIRALQLSHVSSFWCSCGSVFIFFKIWIKIFSICHCSGFCALPAHLLLLFPFLGDLAWQETTPQRSQPRHQELLDLYRWLCVSTFVFVFIKYMQGFLCVWAACHYTPAQTPCDHWQMVCTLCMFTDTFKSLWEATANHHSSLPSRIQATHISILYLISINFYLITTK